MWKKLLIIKNISRKRRAVFVAAVCTLLAMLTGSVSGQSEPTSLPDAPSVQGTSKPSTTEDTGGHRERPISETHAFWDRENLLLFAGIGAMRTLDYTSTRNMQRRGREEILLPDDVVNSTPGFVALEIAGGATSVGISYVLHRTGHHKLERWLSIGHIGVAGFGAARNYALDTKRAR